MIIESNKTHITFKPESVAEAFRIGTCLSRLPKHIIYVNEIGTPTPAVLQEINILHDDLLKALEGRFKE